MSSMDIDNEAVDSQNFGGVIMEGGRIKRDEIVSILDGIDREVETFRKQAIELQERRDRLHTRIDLLRTDFLAAQVDADPDEIKFHLKRVNDRLNTVDINVKTHRDDFQIESIHHINNLIDEIIRFNDPIEQRRKCQEYLNSCTSSIQYSEIVLIDKKFENHLLSCALDDQKLIRKRLEALLHYMMKQMVSE